MKRTVKTVILSVCIVNSLLGQFVRNTTSGLTDEQRRSSEGFWADYDNDGDKDIFIVNFIGNEALFTHSLFSNNGDGTFSLSSTDNINNDTQGNGKATWVDYDNDGYLDLYVANSGGDFFYTNQQDGSFIKEDLGFTGSSFGAWGDYDNDGDLDLATNARDFFENDGDGTFTQINDNAFVNSSHTFNDLSWIDLNNDTNLDIVTFAFSGGGGIFLNNGDGTFTEDNSSVLNNVGNAENHCWGDFTNNGYLDLFIANYDTNELYENNGDGSFTKVDESAVLITTYNEFPEGSNWGDYNNDGYLDLFMATSTNAHLLFENDGAGGFIEVNSDEFNHGDSYGYSANWSDFNNDGFLDVFCAVADPELDATSADENYLYENEGNQNDWIKIDLRGSQSNHFGVGSILHLHDNGSQQTRSIFANGFGSDDMTVHFGVGSTFGIDSLEIMWPGQASQSIKQILSGKSIVVDQSMSYDPPAPPDNLSIADQGNLMYSLSWDHVGGTEEILLFNQVDGGSFDMVGSIVGSSSQVDLEEAAAYVYTIASVDDFQHSVFRDSLEVNTPLLAPSGISSVQNGLDVTISWTDESEKEDQYIVEVASLQDFSDATIVEVEQNGTSTELEDLIAEQTYYVRVKATNQSGFESGYVNVEFMLEPLGLTADFSAVQAYPNPFSERLRLLNTDSRPITVKLVDMSGKQLFVEVIRPGETTVHLQLKPGVYYLLDEFGGKIQKLIRQ